MRALPFPFPKKKFMFFVGDRVLVVGMTRQPGLATGGNAMGFDRQLLLTHPDYQTLCTLWVKLVQDGARELEQGENAILARLAEGLPAGIIQKVVNSAIKVDTLPNIEHTQATSHTLHPSQPYISNGTNRGIQTRGH